MPSSPSNDHETQDPVLDAYFNRRPNLVRYFAARTGSLAQAEDLAQELYLKLASRKEVTGAHTPEAMLFRIARNLMLDTARGARRSELREVSWRAESGAFVGAYEISQAPSADEELVTRERMRELAAAVLALPPQMQRAFRLHKLEGRSQADTAHAMGVSVKAVEKHISLAIQSLSRKLQT